MAALARLSCLLSAVALALVATQPAAPQETKPEMRENCPGLVASNRPRVVPASMRHSASQTRVNALKKCIGMSNGALSACTTSNIPSISSV